MFCALTPSIAGAQTMQLNNGQWFDGARFNARTMYVVDGVLRNAAPARVDTTIDLSGRYVVPGFGEAHNHNVAQSSRTDAQLARYIDEGIFYVLNPNSLPGDRVANKVNGRGQVHAIFANGGLNVTGGHPSGLVERNIARGVWKREQGEGAFHHSIDSLPDLERKWPAILAAKPDLIKIYLLFSGEHEQRRGADHKGLIGLDPKLVRPIVQRAHAAGLRVIAHTENVEDFRVAVDAGVDILAHMPGYGWLGTGDSTQFMLTPALAREAATRNVAVVSTLAFDRRVKPGRSEGELRRDQMNARNLRVLREAGVNIVIGSDNYGATSRSEALYLSDLGVFSNAELLQMWGEATPRLILPGEAVGRLRDGYHANFVVLDGNPLTDFSNTTRIHMRVLHGSVVGER